jgi:hypothetical protein
MNLPQFNAEASLRRSTGIYGGQAVPGRSGGAAVLPMLPICTNCSTVGRFPGIGGVGLRSCCEEVWTCSPITNRCSSSWNCWSESCTPPAGLNAP